jgi:very-short-patch-repair endonuclease
MPIPRTSKTCPKCGFVGKRLKDVCKSCSPKLPRTYELKICVKCGNEGERQGDTCFACTEKRIGAAKVCPVCEHVGYRKTVECAKCLKFQGKPYPRPENKIWNEKMTQFAVDHYADNGAAWIADRLGLTIQQVRHKAGKLGLNLTKEATAKIVHAAAADYMTKNNPSKTANGRKKISERLRGNLPIRMKLMDGHAASRKENPTGSEKILYDILSGFGVMYEPQFILDYKYILDVKIGNLVIEVDGEWWHGHPRFDPLTERQSQQKEKDVIRDRYLESQGYVVERVWEKDLTPDLIRKILVKHGVLSPQQCAS